MQAFAPSMALACAKGFAKSAVNVDSEPAMSIKNTKSRIFQEALMNALCACMISYCLVSFLAGQTGLLAYRDLGRGIEVMRQRVVDLEAENERLSSMKESLLSDPDAITREARRLGYIRPGEKIVLLSPGPEKTAGEGERTINEPIKAGVSTGLPDLAIKTLAALIGLSVFLASLVLSLSVPERKKAPLVMADQA